MACAGSGAACVRAVTDYARRRRRAGDRFKRNRASSRHENLRAGARIRRRRIRGLPCQDGHEVIGVDPERTKVDLINAGDRRSSRRTSASIIAEQVAAGRLRATTDVGDAVRHTDLALVCVGTPSLPNGGIDLTLRAARVRADRRGDRHAPGRAGDRDAQHHAAGHDARRGDPDAREASPARRPARTSASASTPSSCAKAPRCTTTTTRRRP